MRRSPHQLISGRGKPVPRSDHKQENVAISMRLAPSVPLVSPSDSTGRTRCPMLWKKEAACCGFVFETTKTELGEYGIFDTTITRYGQHRRSLSAAAAGPGAQIKETPVPSECTSRRSAKACCEQHFRVLIGPASARKGHRFVPLCLVRSRRVGKRNRPARRFASRARVARHISS